MTQKLQTLPKAQRARELSSYHKIKRKSWSNFIGSVSDWAFGPPPYPWISFSARFCPKVQLWRRLYREGYYPKVSMNPSFWLYFWYILTTYWLQFGYILPTCWLHSVTFWLHFGYILAAFWILFVYILATIWLHFADMLATFCNFLVTFWLHSGYILATFLYIFSTFWIHFATFWIHFSFILATSSLHFGYILAILSPHVGYIRMYGLLCKNNTQFSSFSAYYIGWIDKADQPLKFVFQPARWER